MLCQENCFSWCHTCTCNHKSLVTRKLLQVLQRVVFIRVRCTRHWRERVFYRQLDWAQTSLRNFNFQYQVIELNLSLFDVDVLWLQLSRASLLLSLRVVIPNSVRVCTFIHTHLCVQCAAHTPVFCFHFHREERGNGWIFSEKNNEKSWLSFDCRNYHALMWVWFKHSQ